MDIIHVVAIILLAVFLCLSVGWAYTYSRARPAYAEVFYPSGSLSIQAYLYKPYGDGPFPVVIYNHGKRNEEKERRPVPNPYIGKLLTGAGYLVMVVERRGYGRSDGPTISEEVGDNKKRLVPRLQAETDDVLAAVDYLRTLSFADTKRIGIMGRSHGGIISMLAIGRSKAFSVAANQAGGALTWNGNPDVRSALITAAEKATTPTLLQVAQNDRTTSSIITLAGIFKERGVPHRMMIYEAFTPERLDPDIPPGHKVFSAQGMKVWERDLLEFLDRYLGATSTTPLRALEPVKSQQ